MGIFDKMKAAVGLGGTKITIILDNEEPIFRQGESITGKLEVKGGSVEQTINQLKIQLKSRAVEPGEIEEVEYADGHVEYDGEPDTTETETLDEIVLDEPFQVNSAYHETFPFDFPIPYEADITIEGELAYFLYAQADIPGAIDTRTKQPIEVVSSFEIQAVEVVLEENFGFEFQGEYSENGWVMAEFLSPKELSRTIERVALAMMNSDDGLMIELFTDLEDMDLRDFMRSSIGKDIHKYKVVLPYDQIVPDKENADLEKIAEVFKEIFSDLKWF